MRDVALIAFFFCGAVVVGAFAIADHEANASRQDCRTRTYDSCMRGSDVGNEACVAVAEGLCR